MENRAMMRLAGLSHDLEIPHQVLDRYRLPDPWATTRRLYAQCCGDAQVVVDLGAHVGYFTALAAESVPADALLVAVAEAEDDIDLLRRNLDRYPREIDVRVGDGRAAYDLAALPERSGRRTVVRVDVGSATLAVLESIADLIEAAQDPRLFVELDLSALHERGGEHGALLGWIANRGMRTFALDDDAGGWTEVTAATDVGLFEGKQRVTLYAVRAERCAVVAFVLHNGGVGGAERTFLETAQRMVSDGFLVAAVVPVAGGELAARALECGCWVHPLPALRWWYRRPADASGQALPTGDAKWNLRRVVAALTMVAPDVVVSVTSAIPQGAAAAAALRLPHVWRLHEYGDRDHGFELPFGGATRLGEIVAGLSDAVVANSQAVLAHYNCDRVAEGRSLVIPSLPRATVRAPGRAAPSAPYVVGVVGALHEGKGQRDAVRAAAVARQQDRPFHLRLVGPLGMGGEDRVLADLASELGIVDAVEFTQTTDRHPDPYAGLDLVVVASRNEAFGRVPFEAAAARIPVVYAASGGVVEYMRDGQTGIAYPAGDVDALEAAIARVLTDPALYEHLSTGAHERLQRWAGEQAGIADFEDLVRGPFAARDPQPLAAWAAFVTRILLAHDGIDESQEDVGDEDGRARLSAGFLRAQLDSVVEQRDRLLERVHLEEALRCELEAARATIAAAAVERDAAAARLHEAQAAYDAAHAEATAAGQRLVELAREKDELVRTLEAERGSLREAIASAAHERDERAAMQRTVSWRLTRPLRAVRGARRG